MSCVSDVIFATFVCNRSDGTSMYSKPYFSGEGKFECMVSLVSTKVNAARTISTVMSSSPQVPTSDVISEAASVFGHGRAVPAK